MTLYADLDVPPDADRETLTRAHRKAVKRHHPDAGGDREKFERVQRAWMVLSNPERRERYDRTGEEADQPENELSQLTGIVMAAFDRAMEHPIGFESCDIIAKAGEILRGDILTAKGNIAKARQFATRFETAKRRLRFSGDGPDMIGRVLDDRLREIAAKIVEIERNVATMERAAEHLKLYGWDFDRPDAQAWTMVTYR